jgi:hypothetical protein
MHGPVRAPRFAELPGAVERIDDPDAFGVEPDRIVVLGLLGQHGVAMAPLRELCRDVVVRTLVASVSKRRRIIEADVLTNAPEQLTGSVGEPARESSVNRGCHQYAPELRHTAERVRNRITRSSEKDQFST